MPKTVISIDRISADAEAASNNKDKMIPATFCMMLSLM